MAECIVERTAEAPVIWFDGVPVFGISPASGRLKLETFVQEPGPDGSIIERRVAVAHLRFGMQALDSLLTAIMGIRNLVQPQPNGTRPN